MDPALSVAEAKAAIEAALVRIEDRQSLPLNEALGRVLASDLMAAANIPAHDNSAMDGWAMRSADLAHDATRLTPVGRALAGHPYPGHVGPRQCVHIMTGAVIPDGADTVVMQEMVELDGNEVIIPGGQRAGQNIRLAGEDIALGSVALPAGTLLRPAHLGVAASLGQSTLTVTRRPRVAVFSTGDELRQAGETLPAGAIYDSNRQMLLAMLTRLGCETLDLGVVADKPARLEAALNEAAAWADAVVTSAGVSSGDADHTRAVLEKLGEVKFCAVAMRPGRPMSFGHLHGHARRRPCMLFALPGNPVAAAVSFVQFARGALLAMQGCTDAGPPTLQARAREAIAKKPGRTEYQRGIIERDSRGAHVRLTGAQGSGMLRSLCQADCLVVLHHDQGEVKAGEWVDVLPFEGLM